MNIVLRRLAAHNFKHLQEIELLFPASGSVLVEGHNEAGKSTIFEAVFFALYGRPLAPDQDYRIEHLKGYGQEEMRVELEFTIDDRPFRISRRFGKSHRAELAYLDLDGKEQTITAQREIQKRLQQEMRLSADALLNTCFVEQKKLGKLESLDRTQRRETINELLNLQILTDLAAQFRVNDEDAKRLSAQKQRVEVARLDAEIPEREAEALAARRCLLYAQALEAAERIERLTEQVAQLEGRRGEIAARQRVITNLLRAWDGLKARLSAIRTDLTHRAGAWQTALESHAAAARSLDELEELAAALPGREEELGHIEDLRDRLVELERLETELDSARSALDGCEVRRARMQDMQAELDRLSEDLRVRRAVASEAQRTVALARTRDALADWAQAAELGAAGNTAEKRLPEVIARQEESGRRMEDAGARGSAAARRAVAGYVVVAAGVVALAAGIALRMAIPAGMLAVIVLGVGVALIAKGRAGAASARADECRARSERDSLAGERRALEASASAHAGQVEEWTQRDEACRSALAALGEPVPSSPAAARVRIVDIDVPATTDVEEAERQAQSAVMTADNACVLARERLEAERRALQDARPDELEARVRDLASDVARRTDVRPALEARRLPVESPGLSTRVALLARAIEQDRDALSGLPEARDQVRSCAVGAEAKADELGAAWQAALGEEPLPASPAHALERLAVLERAIQQELAEINEPALRAEADDLSGQDRALAQEIAVLNRDRDRLADEQRTYRAQLGAEADDLLDSLPGRVPELRDVSRRTVEAWATSADERRDAVRQLAARRAAFAQPLGLGDDPLDLVAEQETLSEENRRIQVKRRAGEIVARTRRSIVDRVMPLTLQNMRRLLPLLTEGRYQDVQWHEEANVLEVYDLRARAWQRKRVFSGGAKDQISLALRLAFALATLPGEHAVRPGWLVLDEPLSSFDRDRTRALVDLVTRGLVRKQFSQIFLVSHSASFDPAQFGYRLRLEHGRVVESTLPAAALPKHAVVAAPVESATRA